MQTFCDRNLKRPRRCPLTDPKCHVQALWLCLRLPSIVIKDWPFWMFSAVWFCSSWTGGRGTRWAAVCPGSEHPDPATHTLLMVGLRNVYTIYFLFVYLRDTFCWLVICVTLCSNYIFHPAVEIVKIRIVQNPTSGFFFPFDFDSFPSGGNERTFFLVLFPIDYHNFSQY